MDKNEIENGGKNILKSLFDCVLISKDPEVWRTANRQLKDHVAKMEAGSEKKMWVIAQKELVISYEKRFGINK